MKKLEISPEQSLTFSDYFKLRARTEEILEYFGYKKVNEFLNFQPSIIEMPMFDYLSSQIEDHLIHISLENEITRREFLIAPILSFVRHLTHAKLNSEYWFEVSHQLKGSLDYYLRRESELLVVEAKNADLNRAFAQLAVELVALDQAEETDKEIIYGAVSTGQEWQFGKLNRTNKTFYQGVNVFVLPNNLEEILRILIGILESK